MTTSKSKEEREDEQSGGGIAVAEKPKPEWGDDDPVTVLYGWGRVPPGSRCFVDKQLFVDGVGRNIRYKVAKHWKNRTRPDGKSEQVYGSISIQAILPNDATEADFCKATGVKPTPIDQFAVMLAGVDLDALAAQLGTEKLRTLIAGLEKHLPDQKKGA